MVKKNTSVILNNCNHPDLNNSYAYGDSSSDLSMLYAVGNPVVVNPDLTLRRIANQESWTISCWN